MWIWLCSSQSLVMAQSLRLPSQAWGGAARNPLIPARKVGRCCVKSARGAPSKPKHSGISWQTLLNFCEKRKLTWDQCTPSLRLLTVAPRSQQPSDECLSSGLSSWPQSSGSSYISRWPNAPAARRWRTHRGLHRRPVMAHRVSESWPRLLSLSPSGGEIPNKVSAGLLAATLASIKATRGAFHGG